MIRITIALVGAAVLLTVLATGLRSQAGEVTGDFARGAKLYGDNCARCHKVRAPTEHRDRDWSIIIQHMRIVAGLPGQQARDIEAFMRAANNPPQRD